MTDEFPPHPTVPPPPQVKTTTPPDQTPLAAARELGPRPAPQPEPGRVAAVIGHRYAPILLALAFGGALVLVSLD